MLIYLQSIDGSKLIRLWGARIEALGVGPAPIPQKKLNVEKLSDAIIQATTDASMKERAESIGRQIHDEDGVKNAVDFIHAWIKR
ncbi:MAG: hypothetical protein JXM70_25405 [Pirellulales bacterium]|nr:hypothetical protein [Pirellulales bacterium]